MAKWPAVVVLGLLSCEPGEVRPPPPTPGLARVPKVNVESVVVANPADPPPVVFVLDANRDLYAATVATWDLLSTTDPVVGSHRTTPYGAELRLREGEGKSVAEIYASFARSDASIESAVATPSDDEDDEDETPYKKSPPPPNREAVLARMLARSQRLARNELREVAGPRTVYTGESTGLGPLATAVTEWTDDPEKSNGVLLAAPTLPATELIALVVRLQPKIAVATGTRVRPLRLDTSEEDGWDPGNRWIELRLGASDLTLEAVPETPLAVPGPPDLPTLAAALDEARSRRDLDPLTRVDVLVEPSVNVQRLIDVLVALEQVGVRMVGLGEIPATDSLAARKRGHRSAQLSIGQPNSQGDLDKAIIRKYIKRQSPEILACYATSSVYLLGGSGTIQTQFFTTPNGNVATASASGLDPGVANCVANVIKAIEFPKPKGGGGVQVNYPFTFRR